MMRRSRSLAGLSMVVAGILLILYVWSVFSGLWLGWARHLYDEWRLREILLLVIFMMIAIVRGGLAVNFTKRIGCLILMLGVVALGFATLAFDTSRAMLDLALYAALMVYVVTVAKLMADNRRISELINSIAALTPFPVFVLFCISLANFNPAAGMQGWNGSFNNIRYYDDLLLPCLFFLWGGSWSGRCIDIFLKILIGVIAVSTLLVDGARGVLTSMVLAVIITALLKKREKTALVVPVLSCVGAMIVMNFFALEGDAINRTTTSGRGELYELAWRYFLNQPIIGIGGMGWGLYQQGGYLYDGVIRNHILHPHNIFVQWVVEWGAVGWVVIIFGIYFFVLFVKRRNELPFFCFAGFIALLLNCMISGSGIYPHTQILYGWFFGWVISFLIQSESAVDARVQWNSIPVIVVLMIFLVVNAGVIMSAFSAPELPVLNRAPRYWESGTSIVFPVR